MNNRITKYEKVRIIGVRATQLSMGAKPLIDVSNMTDILKIAEKEFEIGVIPISIIRTYPNGKKVRVDILKK